MKIEQALFVGNERAVANGFPHNHRTKPVLAVRPEGADH
jgi:hypothetical protein